MAALLYLVIGNQNTMAVFPNYYQMAVQFTVNPPIPEPLVSHQPGTEEQKDQFLTPSNGQKQQV